MPKLKNYGPGKRVNVWIPEAQLKLWEGIENKSGFVQIALNDAVGIMTWAILKKEEPEKYKRPADQIPIQDVLPKFNKAYPLDPLTAKRLGKETKWPENSPKKQELW